ncbi:hypothetical protein TNCV_3418261 [Trichonephila clavipes]|nr:hypothetical protein TNCV_3418261 [Trichonephila clavipes]
MSRLKCPPVGVPAQVSSSVLDHGLKLRSPSPNALEQLYSETLVFIQEGSWLICCTTSIHTNNTMALVAEQTVYATIIIVGFLDLLHKEVK